MPDRIPFFEEEETKLPGLQSLGVLKGLTNPASVSKTDIAGLIGGGLAGWFIANKFPNMIVKYVGVVVGAELGILIARWLGGKQ